jgi:Ca-activated chloride channel family protein
LNAALDRLRTQRGTAVGSGILTALNAIFENDPKAQPLPADSGFGRSGGGFGGFGGAQTPQAAPDQSLTTVPDTMESAPVAPGSYTSAAVVLLTDGQTNTGPDPLDVADEAANRGVRVFTVGIGTTTGDVVGAEGRFFRVQLDEDTLKKIAQNTAASYYKADNTDDLLRIYKALSVRLTMGREHTEITALVLAGALLLFLIGAVLSLFWFNRAAI